MSTAGTGEKELGQGIGFSDCVIGVPLPAVVLLCSFAFGVMSLPLADGSLGMTCGGLGSSEAGDYSGSPTCSCPRSFVSMQKRF